MRNPRRLFFIGLLFLAIVASILFVGASKVSADPPVVHVVGWGDTLFSIATRYSTTVNALMQANNLRDPDFVFVGQRLTIPGTVMAGTFNPTTYVVQPNDTLFSIATRNGTTVNALMQANGLYNYWIYVGQALKIPGYAVPLPASQHLPQNTFYIVRAGDYLASIAARYRSTPYAIQIANKLSNPSFIWTGQKLYIPDSQSPARPAVVYNPLPAISIPPPANPPVVVQSAPVAPTMIAPLSAPVSAGTNSSANVWEAVLLSNTTGTSGSCSLAATVVGKTDWPVVIATPDGSWISEARYTGSKPERGPYVVEFAHACTGVWRVIPLGLYIYADVQMTGGHAEVEFHPRLN